MKEVVVIDAVRTPLGKANKKTGIYRDVRSDDLAAIVVEALLKRNPFDAKEIEDVIFGCALQREEQGHNVARQIVLKAGLPVEVSATTVNRLCGSSLQAINQATQAIMTGCGDIMIAGGMEHMTHVPMEEGVDFNPKLFKYYSKATINMGITAELLTVKNNISRKEQDEFSVLSHEKTAAAHHGGRFKKEMIPVYGRLEDGKRSLIDRDQGFRENTTAEILGHLDPIFNPKGGTITAGNSSQISDGASALLLMSSDKAKELGFKPMAKIRSMATAGVSPSLFGLGPISATTKALKRANLTLNDIDAIELNEAFAVQSLAVIDGLKMDINKVNLNGGAIALGHPLGCSGARISTTLLHIMQDKKLSLGLATLCIGLGQGIATVFEAM